MATVTRTTTWSDNQVLTAAALNGEYNHLLDALALVNADISSGAGIVESKLTFSGSGHGHTGGTDGKQVASRYGFFVPGNVSITNNVSWNPTVPTTQTVTTLYAYAVTAPVGSVLTVQVYNITQAKIVASLSISAGANTASTTSMTNASLTAGDVLRMDVTAIGSTTAGAFVSLVLF